MKTRPISGMLLLTIALMGCGHQNTQTEQTETKETTYSYMEKGYGEPTARLMISGMSCEQMCGTRVKSAVAGLEGIKEIHLAFDADVNVDTLTVTFDPVNVRAEDMVKAIQELQGTSYHVDEVWLSKEAKTSHIREEGSTGRVQRDRTKVTAERFSIPNIFDALKRVSSI